MKDCSHLVAACVPVAATVGSPYQGVVVAHDHLADAKGVGALADASILVAAVLVGLAVSAPGAIDRLAPPVVGATVIGALLTALILILRADR